MYIDGNVVPMLHNLNDIEKGMNIDVGPITYDIVDNFLQDGPFVDIVLDAHGVKFLIDAVASEGDIVLRFQHRNHALNYSIVYDGNA